MVQSPCVRNCCLDNDDVCMGCGRTINEITGWHHAEDAEKQAICQRAAVRLQQRFAAISLRVTRQSGTNDPN